MRKIKYSTPPYKKCTQAGWVCLLFILISGCDRPPNTIHDSPEIPFTITWQPELPRAEQPIVFSLTLPSDLAPELSQVRGVSMYMGRIPLQWQAVGAGRWQATLLVGACSEPTMQWQLTVPLRRVASSSVETTVPTPLQVIFNTVTN
ncbi:hypothetical protein [Pseudidiomarina mangrovi]|uniref:hypothetical protein n=1 Tax=Pseudidiomarina mangrovi TaxID=2487133 RepID=UPI000FCC6748|nr:hypothetical protein [Pseudidiomarina mangrovi]